MKKWKQLTCILLVVLLLLNCCPPAKADDRQTLTLFCFSTEMEHGLRSAMNRILTALSISRRTALLRSPVSHAQATACSSVKTGPSL